MAIHFGFLAIWVAGFSLCVFTCLKGSNAMSKKGLLPTTLSEYRLWRTCNVNCHPIVLPLGYGSQWEHFDYVYRLWADNALPPLRI